MYSVSLPCAKLLNLSSKHQLPTNIISLVEKAGFDVDNQTEVNNDNVLVVLITSCGEKDSIYSATRHLRLQYEKAFMCVWHEDATEDPFFRQACFGVMTEGANMVTHDETALSEALKLVIQSSMRSGDMICPFCTQDGFSEDELWIHNPLYHVNCLNPAVISCPICEIVCKNEDGDPYAVHLRNCHGPCGRGEIEPEGHTGLFAIVICKRPIDGKYLMVQEFANSGFWVPGGQLDAGESLRAAVERETIEEAGVEVNLLGVLNVMIQGRGRWRRIIFYAEPKHDSPCPKTLPDYESTGACWVTLDDVNRGRTPLLKHHRRGNLNNMHEDEQGAKKSGVITHEQLKLRGYEPLQWFNYIENGGEILPLAVPAEYEASFRDVPF